MPNAQETLLEVTPQIQELELGNSIEIEIITDADDYSMVADNQNISFNGTTKFVDNNTNLTHSKTEITADIEGDTHITISATAQNKTEKIIEWDLRITPKQASQPTTPSQPNMPNFTYPIKLEVGGQYINAEHNIVVITEVDKNSLMTSGEYRDVFVGIVYDRFFHKEQMFFLEDGTKVVRDYANFPFRISLKQNNIVEYDNKYLEVFDIYIAYMDYAVDGAIDTKGKVINLLKRAMKTIEVDEDSFSLVINENLRLNLLNEEKFNQVCKFLGIKYVYK